MARVKQKLRFRAGWSGRGVAALALLVLALWTTGLLINAWPAEQAPLLEVWQMQLRHLAVVLHGVGAWVFCFLAGRWVWHHIQLVWPWPRNRTWWLGMASAGIALLGALSGLLLLYGPGDSHDAVALFHWWGTLAWPLLLGLHARALWRRLRPTRD